MQGTREMKEAASALVYRMEVGTPGFQKISVKCVGMGARRGLTWTYQEAGLGIPGQASDQIWVERCEHRFTWGAR